MKVLAFCEGLFVLALLTNEAGPNKLPAPAFYEKEF